MAYAVYNKHDYEAQLALFLKNFHLLKPNCDATSDGFLIFFQDLPVGVKPARKLECQEIRALYHDMILRVQRIYLRFFSTPFAGEGWSREHDFSTISPILK